jgi:hypothetical protein
MTDTYTPRRCPDWDEVTAEEPKDGEPICGASHRSPDSYCLSVCTRKPGHEPPHHAHGEQECYRIWGEEKVLTLNPCAW